MARGSGPAFAAARVDVSRVLGSQGANAAGGRPSPLRRGLVAAQVAGSTVFVRMKGIRAYQHELIAKNYANMKPGIEDEPWGLVMTVIDPFGNHIRFCEAHAG